MIRRKYCREHFCWYWLRCPACKREKYVNDKLKHGE